jgi:hypothetical protein
MDCTYIRWLHHAEDISVLVNEVPIPIIDNDEGSIHGMGVAEDDKSSVGRLDRMIRDLQAAEGQGRHDNKTKNGNNDGNMEGSFLKHVMKEAKRQLYPGCTKFSKFSFVVKLLYMKSFYRITNTAFFFAILKLSMFTPNLEREDLRIQSLQKIASSKGQPGKDWYQLV